ncbi:MAG: hypothetical protein KC468_03695 [Myxococcales bacterium]|nr:hypothetical protein [Myxococcales bacterium]
MQHAPPWRRAAATLAVITFLGCNGDPSTTETDADSSSDASSESSDSGASTGAAASSSTSAGVTSEGETGAEPGAIVYLGEVWADNWSSMYLHDALIMEDSESITTERSFNSEVFTFEATPPFLLNVVMKDFIENDSGLEYIGSPMQQMGDGGYIAQISVEESGELVAVSSADWRCLTIHEAPLNKDCEKSPAPLEDCESAISAEPEGWKQDDFDDSGWTAATVFTAAEVSPKEGYNDVAWDPSASLIWGGDLETHNTILCRVWVNG